MTSEFGLPVGYSDYSLGIHIPLAVAAIGAQVIEKHFTLDKDLPGPDHKASLDPNELREMVKLLDEVGQLLGNGVKTPCPEEVPTAAVTVKSLLAAYELKAQHQLDSADICVKRPGTGVSPMRYWDYIGKTLSRDYKQEEMLDKIEHSNSVSYLIIGAGGHGRVLVDLALLNGSRVSRGLLIVLSKPVKKSRSIKYLDLTHFFRHSRARLSPAPHGNRNHGRAQA